MPRLLPASPRICNAGAILLAGVLLPVAHHLSTARLTQAKSPQGAAASAEAPLIWAGRRVDLTLTLVSDSTIRISLSPIQPDGTVQALPATAVLTRQERPGQRYRIRSLGATRVFKLGTLRVTLTRDPFSLQIEEEGGRVVERLGLGREKSAFTFLLGGGPVFGLGAGGPQYNRRGSFYSMENAHGAWHLATLGGRMPIPWLIGTTGWAMFVHLPLGTFDLTGSDGRFEAWPSEAGLPLDVFVVAAREPARIMEEYARLTGYPHLPPLWTLGYQQSHRTLASPEVVLSVAKTFREKKLPCDVVIYLGTGFCPSGWNTGHGSFEFNPRAFRDPGAMIRELRDVNLRVVLHVVNPLERLYGRAADGAAKPQDEDAAANYWAKHLEVFRLGVDGWWPDLGEDLSVESRLARIQMYWEGPQRERPGLRPYALHRTGYAGLQRYGWLWSGDVDSTWKTLEAHIPVALNTSLSGVPYWGMDTGGFYPTQELTGELYARWFQFSAFCPLFRSHGRAWKLRLPWGWNTGDLGPPEQEGYRKTAGLPDTKELLNPEVEPVCRKYLELRYRMLPYLYTLVREAHDTGLPVMRALWLHYPDDPRAVERGDEYLWGRDMLVAPVTEKGATSRQVYLPRGAWYDFWTEGKIEGGRSVDRPVDLATIPLYVRAGTILPFGPVKQHTAERANQPLTVLVYPGADGEFMLYEDDGTTFDYQEGEFMWLRMSWKDGERRLTVELVEGSRMLPPFPRSMEIRVAGTAIARSISFDGKPAEVVLSDN